MIDQERDWSKIKHFKKSEWKKDPDKVEWSVIELADEMRSAAGKPILIHVAWDDAGHVQDSTHFGIATGFDFHFVGMTLLEQWLFAERFPWMGIGIYPYWNNPGLHCDLRSLTEHANLGRRWWRDAAGHYKSLDREIIKILLAQEP